MNSITKLAPDATSFLLITPPGDPWSSDWSAGYDMALAGIPVEADAPSGLAAGYQAGLRALGRGATPTHCPTPAEPPAIEEAKNAPGSAANWDAEQYAGYWQATEPTPLEALVAPADWEAVLDAAERAGWDGGDLVIPVGLDDWEVDELLVTWRSGQYQRAADEAEVAAQWGGEWPAIGGGR